MAIEYRDYSRQTCIYVDWNVGRRKSAFSQNRTFVQDSKQWYVTGLSLRRHHPETEVGLSDLGSTFGCGYEWEGGLPTPPATS